MFNYDNEDIQDIDFKKIIIKRCLTLAKEIRLYFFNDGISPETTLSHARLNINELVIALSSIVKLNELEDLDNNAKEK